MSSPHAVRRDTVYDCAKPNDPADAGSPTKSLPVRLERSLRKVDLESGDGTKSEAVLIFESQYLLQNIRKDSHSWHTFKKK